MARHRKKYKQHSSGKDEGRTANKLFDEFGLENCKIELVEEYPCNSLMELRRREGFHIQNHDCVNTRIAGRTDQEYREQNREKKNEQNRIYRLNNPDKVKAFRDRVDNKERRAKYNQDYYRQHADRINEKGKENRKNNLEMMRERDRLHYQKHKETILARKKERREAQKKQQEPEEEPLQQKD
eukprot:Skav201728  [mRNA]  locus=scaffold311:672189:672737:- [translate_table: standard]